MKKRKDQSMKNRAYADFANSPTYKKHLKPFLEALKNEVSVGETEPETEFDSIKRDLKRSNTNKTVNRIIRQIEMAESKIK